ncbi:MAG TPA: hypothetical protein VHH54_03275, partial [Actinomycetota bacterium]|nr:hypothetical protein [Actinomycetota bacterium]
IAGWGLLMETRSLAVRDGFDGFLLVQEGSSCSWTIAQEFLKKTIELSRRLQIRNVASPLNDLYPRSGDLLTHGFRCIGRDEQIPGARMEVIEGAGHISNLEAPAEFNRLLQEHMSSVA